MQIGKLAACAAAIAALVPRGAPAVEAVSIRRVLGTAMRLDATRWPDGRRLLDLPRTYLRAGENRLIIGRLTARNASISVVGQLVGVGCGGRRGGTVVTTRNNEGRTKGYPGGRGILAIKVRYLMVADRDGWYTCSLWGAALHRRGALVALPGSTSVEMKTTSDPTAEQFFEDKCSANGTEDSCTYLVPATVRQSGQRRPNTARVFDFGYNGHLEKTVADAWRATLEADPARARAAAERGVRRPRFVQLVADLQVTTCYQRTGSCIDAVDRYGYAGRSVVESVAEIAQFPILGTCPARVAGYPVRTIVTDAAHHQKVHLVVRLRPSDHPSCSWVFSIRLTVRVVSGNPVKIETGPGPYSSAGSGMVPPPLSYSNPKIERGAWYSNAIATLVY